MVNSTNTILILLLSPTIRTITSDLKPLKLELITEFKTIGGEINEIDQIWFKSHLGYLLEIT